MHITTIAMIISVVGLVASFFFVGIIPSILVTILNIHRLIKEKSINNVRALAISLVGVILPLIMYVSTYGLSLPYEKPEGFPFVKQIVYDNYTRLGFSIPWAKEESDDLADLYASQGASDMYYVSDGVIHDESGFIVSVMEEEEIENEKKLEKKEPESIFESIDSLKDNDKKDYGADKKGASDDDMPSYGGLPVGTLILGQYFREDDHNCNPVLVLKNMTGDTYRYECVFTARNEDGDEMAVSEKTVEVVKNGACFVFEGRFDKSELSGKLPAMYEFTITKRNPYERDMSDDVVVTSEIQDNSVVVTAYNEGDKRAKVDAYVLFFDGDELVDCIWMIPRSAEDVSIDPGSSAAIRGDAYYKFDHVETYFSAYEAVGD